MSLSKYSATLKVLCRCKDYDVTPTQVSSSVEIPEDIAIHPTALGKFMQDYLHHMENQVNTDCVNCKKRRVEDLSLLGTNEEES